MMVEKIPERIPYEQAKRKVRDHLKDPLSAAALHNYCNPKENPGFPLEVLRDESLIQEARTALLSLEELQGAIHAPEHATHRDFDPSKFTALHNARRLILDIFGDLGIPQIDFRVLNKRLTRSQLGLIDKLPLLKRARVYKSIELWLLGDEMREMRDELLTQIVTQAQGDDGSGERKKAGVDSADDEATTLFLRGDEIRDVS